MHKQGWQWEKPQSQLQNPSPANLKQHRGTEARRQGANPTVQLESPNSQRALSRERALHKQLHSHLQTSSKETAALDLSYHSSLGRHARVHSLVLLEDAEAKQGEGIQKKLKSTWPCCIRSPVHSVALGYSKLTPAPPDLMLQLFRTSIVPPFGPSSTKMGAEHSPGAPAVPAPQTGCSFAALQEVCGHFCCF